jgi:putative peptidoglycan lipid II flippase
MAGLTGSPEARREALGARLNAGLRQIAVLVVPSAMAFLALGDVVAALIFQTGRFTRPDAVYVWGILAGSAVGLLASTLGRLYASTYYALGDPRTPLNYAILRVMLTTLLGYGCAIPVPRLLGIAPSWGAAGLTASAGIAGWVEMLLLRRTLNVRIGKTGLAAGLTVRLWTAAAAAAAVAWAAKLALPFTDPLAVGIVVLGVYGVVFFGATLALRIPEAATILDRVARRLPRRR